MLLIRRFETEAERQYKAALHRRLLPPLLRAGGRDRRDDACARRRRPSDHGLPLPRLRARSWRTAGSRHGRALRARRRLRPRARRLDAPARRRAAATTAAGASSPGQLPIATGLALGLVRQGRQQAVLCELGDGAINMGAWHESLNLAAVWRLPVVFLVMNNEYGMGTSVERASAVTDLHRRAAAYDLPAERVDGDDLLAVAQAASTSARRRARASAVPAVLELVTYRYRGHSVADAGLAYRTRGEIERAHPPRPDLPRARAARRRWRGRRGARAELEHAVEERVAAVGRRGAREPRARRSSDAAHAGCTHPAARRSSRACSPGAPFGERELVFAGGLGE